MTKVMVVHASRHGATAGIAERIGETLQAAGLEARVVPADEARDANADAFVIGSGVYMGNWLKDGLEFIERNLETLDTRPVWLFSSGPLPGSNREQVDDEFQGALGPADGPGSGGRKRIVGLAEAIHARGHRVFLGAFDPSDPPKAISERLVRLMPAAKDILPPGDFRNWPEIEAWARDIAAALAPVPVG